MVAIKRSESPIPLAPSNRGRRQSMNNMISGPEHHQMLAFPQFSYDNGLGGFSMPGMGGESPSESCPQSVYSHHPPSSTYHLDPTAHSGFSSPTSNHSSPNPYGDFNAFPLSPPSTGTTLSSLIIQQQNSSHGHLNHQLPHQPISPVDLSSTISSNATFEIPRSGHHCHLAENRLNRRESYSTTVTDPSYERRHSTVSVGSIRSFQSSSPYSAYASLEPHPSSQSHIYTLADDLSNQGVFYIDSGRHTAPAPSIINTSSVMQSGMMTEAPRLTQPQISSMAAAVTPPLKVATRQYRKKTPPDACAVCNATSTPEWRKGPSGLRTLCNACGLTAGKLSFKEASCVEEVWAQLEEIGRIRFRSQFIFEEHKKIAAAQNWSAHSQNGGRASNTSRNSYSASANSSVTRSSRGSFSSITDPSPRITSNRNPAEIDAAQQLFSLSRAGESGLNGATSRDHSTLSSSTHVSNTAGHLHAYSSPSHAARLNMGSAGDSHHGLTGAFSHQLASPMGDSAEPILGMYASSIHSDNSRRDSSGHRMSISTILNQDPPARSTSNFDAAAQVHQSQQHHQAPHLHHPFFLPHSPQAR
ncbi:hypothetical protein PCANC_25196 [Puccinia coronata f. sp. avenae]|uniref:GATA-type domain-containing protein n=1 Tax=Puccinia coronata f. sp. avenae TaxID=200324 RepID=A0A2N5TTJ4_9BASI|nr:hypothetical protein PCANC_25196 [Puccinia coronata f. sp. avenae]